MPLLSAALPPEALAVEVTEPREEPVAETVSRPAEDRSRRVVAVTSSDTTATAIAAPTATEPPAAVPEADVVSVASAEAPITRSPDVVARVPAPVLICASVRLVTTATAALGVIDTPPAEPAEAVVVTS